jgi:HD-like signal output (HDOD) protein
MNPSQPADENAESALRILNQVGHKMSDWVSPHDMRDHILSLDQLPALPEIARRLLELKNDPLCDGQKLASVVEMDPSLAAQIVRWASSPYYGFRAKSVTVRDAINIVLGFEPVFNLAFGLCSLSPLKTPSDGPLGKRFFWRQTLAGTTLIQKLAQLMDSAERPPLAQLQLTYLLHNTGHLLLAHLFNAQFKYLVELIEANPGMPVLTIERYALGVDHTKLGSWLMQGWDIPKTLQDVCLHHHNPNYRGAGERLVWLVCLTDRLLGEIGVGDACHETVEDTELYTRLRITPDSAARALGQIAEKLDELDQTITALVGQ